MGTTIRRQPLSFPIPASPNYQFLNITDFGGLNVSSNPFVVSSNTASDCLNVYVDEDNALSTRPRLQEKYDLMTLAGLDSSHKVVNIYNLHNGYLLHTIKNGNGYMYRFEEENGVLKSPTIITGTGIPLKKCELFEQNGNIYLLTGDGYKNIIDDKLSDVIGYVPTTTIGKFSKKSVKNDDGTTSIEVNPAGESYESLNLLSDKFKETYFWDGTWSTESLIQYEDDELENNYVENEQVVMYDFTGEQIYTVQIIQALRELFNNPEGKKYFFCWLPEYVDRFGSEYVILALDKFNKMIVSETFGVPFTVMPTSTIDMEHRMVCSDNGLSVAYVSWNEALGQPRLGYICVRPSITSDFKWCSSGFGPYDETEIGFYPSTSTGKYFTISPDGRVISWRSSETKVEYYYFEDLESSSTYNGYILDCTDYDINFISSGIYSLVYATRSADDFNVISSIKHGTLRRAVTDSGNIVLPPGATENLNIWTASEKCTSARLKLLPGSIRYYISMTIVNSSDDVFSKSLILKTSAHGDEDVVVAQSTTSDKWANLNFMYDNDRSYMYFQNDDGSITGRFNTEKGEDISANLPITAKIINASISNNIIYSNDALVEYNWAYTKSSLLFNDNEPKLILIRNVNNIKTESAEEHTKIKSEIQKATLFERFDNNTWFASKNYTFHTEYNDTTYIPLSSYNDLGEDFEDITGLSIVNDNVLATYKRNRIYIITPVTVGSQETYSYTETKNVIGNDVPGAPILTILTEMPTIVSYDGIYALNQLENVQSSDRITTLISESINPRWLKESVDDVNSCLTLNRLYWTYYILPHKKVGDEGDDYTKVYLLDNRTQQWYYWELPVYVTNAMVKDNKTHLISDGRVYTLETSDLIHEYNPDVTEYYDGVDGEKKIITWFWNSQILSLNTINYSKKLVDTTFILTDTDTQDEYGLDYSFKAWRKSVSETNATTISNNIHYVQSTTKRTMIPRFNFIQIRLSNTSEDLDNNKLRLVGLGLKYVLLEGLY